MNIQQFQYVLAVAECQHFEQAAEKCFVTQSTLSTMIGRFEEEIGITIFDRKTKPVSITQEGAQIIQQLRVILKEIDSLGNMMQELKGEIVGELRLGIIPTVAPYILPHFLSRFALTFPKVRVIVQEMTTPEIQKALKHRTLDVGIVAMPLADDDLREHPLYKESFLLYDCYSKKRLPRIAVENIDYNHLWLLQEGHCLRTQVEQICELSNFEFKAGSIDSLIRFTKANNGMTLLPYMATLDLPKADRERLTDFVAPVPVRAIGLVVHKHFVKKRLLEELQKMIQGHVASKLPTIGEEQLVRPF
jgi:LysR family transcriptional regulator, hydrogen peroxide-inducible genes activator